jgi:hypothetical protein
LGDCSNQCPKASEDSAALQFAILTLILSITSE